MSERARQHRHSRGARRPLRALDWLRNEEQLSLILLAGLLLALCVAGGASRAGEIGQVVIRPVAVVLLLILCATRRHWSLAGVRTPMAMIAAVGVVCLVQLIPLPPALWTLLPGRAPFEAAVIGRQPWRPVNLTPDGGLNALLSLSVPLSALAILSGITRSRRVTVAVFLLAMVVIAALLGSLQLAGATFDSLFINETVGEAAGIFANRNHQALFLACGMPLLAWWAMVGERTRPLRPPVVSHRGRRDVRRIRGASGARTGRIVAATGIMAWLLLLVLATGSRAGVVLALGGLGAAVVISAPSLRRAAADRPRWALPAIVLAAVAMIAIVVALGVSNDRALSLRRLAASEDGGGIRFSSLPLLLDLVGRYFPFGSGMGSFDPVFRIVEPFELLAPTYLNHAHNDVIEILIEAGVAGLALVLATGVVWLRLGHGIWRSRHDAVSVDDRALSIAGWSVLTLILGASLVDYPLRTPTIMVLGVIAVWLSRASERSEQGGEKAGAGDAALPS